MRTYDVTLRQKNGTNEVGLMLAPTRRQDGRPGPKSWRVTRAEPFVPGYRTSAESPVYDPVDRLVFSQRTWDDGALIERWSPLAGRSNGYSIASLDVRSGDEIFRGVPRNYGSGRGNKTGPIGVIVPNPFFETPSANSQWATEGTPTSLDLDSTTDPRDDIVGSQHAELVAAASGDGISYTLNNATPWQSKSITVSAYVKRASGAGSIRVTITDSAGSTNGTAAAPTADYGLITATRTVDAAATSLKIVIEATGAGTFYIDDVTVYSGTVLTPTRLVEFEGGIYCAFGRMICKLKTDTTDEFVWEAVYVHASEECTDLQPHGAHLYAAFGGASAYAYSADGAAWTLAAGGVGDDNYAIKFTSSRNELWKAETAAVIRKSTASPETGSSWGSDFSVGTTEDDITALYSYRDTVWVGKEQGLWSFLRFYEDGTAANTFLNQTPEFETQQDDATFSRAKEHAGYLYVKPGAVGLYRTNSFAIENISPLVTRPAAGIPGRVHCFGNSTEELFAFVGAQLLSIREVNGRLFVHTMAPPSVSSLAPFEIGAIDKTTGYTNPGTVTQSGGTFSWSNLSNAAAADDAHTEVQHNGPSRVRDSLVRLRKNGATTGDNKAFYQWESGSSDETNTYGGASDLWGESWTPADINDADFGLAFSVTDDGDSQAELYVANFGFAIPTSATILGITVQIEGHNGTSAAHFGVDNIRINVAYRIPPNVADGMLPRHAGTFHWTVSSVNAPHLLCAIEGTDAEDSEPYAFSDCWALPVNAGTPDLDTTPHAATTGYFRTSRWDGGLPAVVKAGDTLTLFFENMDADQTVTVKYGLDGEGADARTLGTLTGTGQVQTLAFEDLDDPDTTAVGRDWQFQFEISGAKEGFRITGFEFRAHAAQVRRRVWEFTVAIGDVLLNNGQPDPQDAGTTIARLLNLENSAFPIEMVEDLDDDESETTTLVIIDPTGMEQVKAEEYVVGEASQVWRVRLREVINE